jgi:hypothetical protein
MDCMAYLVTHMGTWDVCMVLFNTYGFLLIQMELYLRFQAAYPLVIVGKRMFNLLQPFWINRLKERNVCCCIYHVEMQELLVGFNHIRAKSGLYCHFLCECECEEVCHSYFGSNSVGSRPGCVQWCDCHVRNDFVPKAGWSEMA